MIDKTWTTAALTDDLIKYLWRDRWLAVREVQLTPMGQRADVLAMRRKFNDSPFFIFEIKTQRSDLLADLRSQKWRGYLEHGAVAFAFPLGLAEAKEIPAEAGVYIRGRWSWGWYRAARRFNAPRPSDYLHRRLSMTLADQVEARTRDEVRVRFVAANENTNQIDQEAA